MTSVVSRSYLPEDLVLGVGQDPVRDLFCKAEPARGHGGGEGLLFGQDTNSVLFALVESLRDHVRSRTCSAYGLRRRFPILFTESELEELEREARAVRPVGAFYGSGTFSSDPYDI